MSSAAVRREPVGGPAVLLVEDDAAVAAALQEVLSAEGHGVVVAADGQAALNALAAEPFAVVLLDLNLPGISGLDVLSAGRSLQPDATFLVISGAGTVDTAVEAMRLGAFHFLTKPVPMDEVLLVLERAAAQSDSRRHRRPSAAAAARAEAPGSALVGRSPAMRRMLALMERVARTRATVLVTGETGTGKELVARTIHEWSDRSRGPFVPVQCSALAETLLESELFGHIKGAFTGAVTSRRGLFEDADGGTLFLDEISTISAATQVKLLRALQERRVQRVGGGVSAPLDFRVIAATNEPLEPLVRAGTFRQDLYYRLAIFPVDVPPLRHRSWDIPALAAHIRERITRIHGIEAPELSPLTLERMMSHDWPGNVRELENYLERMMILYAGAATLPFDPPGAASPEAELVAGASSAGWTLDRLEREYILLVMERTGGHQGRAAGALGIDVRTLGRKLKQMRTEP